MTHKFSKDKTNPPDQEVQRLRLLADVAFHISQLKTSDDVADFICLQIKSIIGSGIVGATLLDESTRLASIKGLRGLDDARLIKAGLNLTGTDPRKIAISIDDIAPEQLEIYNSGRLELIVGGFYSVFAHKYPEFVSHAIERLLNIRYVYAMGFLHNGRNIGGVAIFTDSDEGVEANRAMIEIIVSHAADVINRLSVEKRDEDSNTRYKLMFESAPIAINISRSANILYANPAFITMFGFKNLEDIRNLAPLELFSPEHRARIMENIQRRGAGLPSPISYEAECLRRDGSKFPVLVSLSTASFADGPATVGFVLDISVRKQNEEKIRSALAEKELLLKEVHHRVKNNMQVISSLLALQSEFVKHPDDGRLFQDSQDRIKSMALVYNKLYRSDNLSNIDLKGYATDLVENLIRSYSPRDKQIDMRIDVANVSLNLDSIVPCGLIINEIVVNSLKHAFKDRQAGLISLIARKKDTGELELVIADDGSGLPEGMNSGASPTLGLMLIHTLAKEQLDGKISVKRDHGTEYTLSFMPKT